MKTTRDGENTFAIALMAAGLVILMAGCGIAIYTNGNEDNLEDRDTEAEKLLETVSNGFVSGSGALSLSRLGSGYDRIDVGSGRSAMIQVETMDGSGLTLYLPDKSTFERKDDGKGSSASRILPVSLDDGTAVPGRLEVVLVG
ncbi:MAG: hypothetical protein JW939_03795 [Candidatus Thermoplasmatota archaeon]|nr:hypothetical protein [Candidatus Thermoplasmatota archaeon]